MGANAAVVIVDFCPFFWRQLLILSTVSQVSISRLLSHDYHDLQEACRVTMSDVSIGVWKSGKLQHECDILQRNPTRRVTRIRVATCDRS
jgi:hypothetical protein